ncbi:ABC transporter ATP-binding protein [Microbacterium resistens]|uniref:ABC transporter ATP-binding protein n=1 Tax=Microbacterium resistens TaxID=156977 RepID=UPI000A443133|nr:ABC transporter ATP-binding protein [Microbacterium resistens]
MSTPDDDLLRIQGLDVAFPTKHGTVHAVSDVSFAIRRGETLSLVGESGSGKSTIARAILGLLPQTRGSITFAGAQLVGMPRRSLRRIRPRMQIILQDPIASLNPRRRVTDIVGEGLDIWPDRVRSTRRQDVDAALREVGLNPEVVADRRPSGFSGGQCQRLAIARALVLRPELLVCDEPVSALDVSVQAQILNLLRSLRQTHALTMLFISHDLGVVKNISDRVMVLYLGKVCEVARTEELFRRPRHPYTRLLLESVPTMEPARAHSRDRAVSDLPSPLSPPSGCRFRTRCAWATEICAREEPGLRESGAGGLVACHHAEKLDPTTPSTTAPVPRREVTP